MKKFSCMFADIAIISVGLDDIVNFCMGVPWDFVFTMFEQNLIKTYYVGHVVSTY